MSLVVTTSSRITTVLDIIHGALRLLQVKSPDVDLTADEVNDALEAFNMMLDGLSNESFVLYHVTKESFNLVAGQQVYTIGAGGDFDTSRPIAIEQATVNISGTDYGITPLAYDDWASVQQKTLQTNYAEYLYIDQTYPLGNIYFYPIPVDAAPTITLYMRKPLDTFDRVTQELSLPKGYARMLKYNLAVELAPEYQTDPGAVVAKIAQTSKADIKRTNTRFTTLRLDTAYIYGNTSTYNIYSDI